MCWNKRVKSLRELRLARYARWIEGEKIGSQETSRAIEGD